MHGRKYKDKSSLRTRCKIVFCLLGLVGRMVIAYDTYHIPFWIFIVQFLQQIDKI